MDDSVNKTYTGTAARVLELLGNGVSQEATASALGISPSYITQLVSDEEFAQQLSNIRYQNLQKHNDRDNKYDAIEDRLLQQLENTVPLMMRPMEVLRAVQVINAAKRRGTSTPEAITNKQQQVTLVMPVKLIQKFTQNINNQVISVSSDSKSQELVTIDAKSLLNKVGVQDDTRQEVARISDGS